MSEDAIWTVIGVALFIVLGMCVLIFIVTYALRKDDQ